MSVAVLMSVWNEELLLPRALRSLVGSGINPRDVFVCDGAWKAGEHVFASAKGPSTDRSREIVERLGARWVSGPSGPWVSQIHKRTQMFAIAGLVNASHAFLFDADEVMVGRFPSDLPDDHANVLVETRGPNDLPGIRGEWPLGDYSPTPIPLLRLFRYCPDLQCVRPGSYVANGNPIESHADDNSSALPVLDGVKLLHCPNDHPPGRTEAKRAYYKHEYEGELLP